VVLISNQQANLGVVPDAGHGGTAGPLGLVARDQAEAARVRSLADQPTAWRLERKHREVLFAARPELNVFAETTSAAVGRAHAHPAWTLLLPVRGGSVTVTGGGSGEVHREGLLLAPQYQYRAGTDGPHVAMYLSAWMAPRAHSLEPRTIGSAATRRLLDALDLESGLDLDAGISELAPVVGPIRPVDSRLAVVIEGLAEADRLDVLAAEVGMSLSRLRAVAGSTVGVPLTLLRLWSRLSRAVGWLPHAPTAVAAAESGFADQPHLTRTARRFLGRTPGELHFASLELRSRTGARSSEVH
jgi:AraC-like DNA-binding protein